MSKTLKRRKESQPSEVVVVTGGRRGIGKAIVTEFCRAGKEVVAIDKSITSDLKQKDCPIHFIQADLAKTSELEDLMLAVEKKIGPYTVFVNCAGIYPTKPALAIVPEEWDFVFNLNLKAPFFLSQLAAQQMIRRGIKGSIINVSSTAGKIARQGASHYCSSKAGLIMMTQVLALEWAEFGIRVNAVCPGVIESEALVATLKDGQKLMEHKEKLAKIPMKRAGCPEEVADAVLFLAESKASSFMTGQALIIDGGYSAGQYYSTFSNFNTAV